MNSLNNLSTLGYHPTQSAAVHSAANQQTNNSSTLHQPLPIHSSGHHSLTSNNSSSPANPPCTVNSSNNTTNNTLSTNFSAESLHSPQSAFSAHNTDSLIQNYKNSDSIRIAAQAAASLAASNLTHNQFLHAAQYNSLSNNNSLTNSPFNPTHIDAQLITTMAAAAMNNNSIVNNSASNTNNLYSNFAAKFAAVVTQQNSHLNSNNASLNSNNTNHSTSSIVSQLSTSDQFNDAVKFNDLKSSLVMPTHHSVNHYSHHLNESLVGEEY